MGARVRTVEASHVSKQARHALTLPVCQPDAILGRGGQWRLKEGGTSRWEKRG